MGMSVWVAVIGIFEIFQLIKCEQYPEFFSEKDLVETFGRGTFNRDHPYRPHKKPKQQRVIKYGSIVPYSPHNVAGQRNRLTPRISPWSSYTPGPLRQGETTPLPEERLFPDFEWPPRDESSRDMAELPKRLTKTNKWGEFVSLMKEEAKKHPKGQIMPNWEQDVEKWAGYSRQLLVRDKYEKEKALRASKEMAKKVLPAQPLVTLQPLQRTPSPGMAMYWGDPLKSANKPAAQTNSKPSQPVSFIKPKPFYTYDRPSGARRSIPGLDEPGFPIDEDPTYAGEENPRKYGAMAGLRNNPSSGYIGDKPSLRSSGAYTDYSADYPAGHSTNVQFTIPGEEENRAMKRFNPGALRSGPSGGAPPPPSRSGDPPGFEGAGGSPDGWPGSSIIRRGPRRPNSNGGPGNSYGYGGPVGPSGYGGPPGPPSYGRPEGNPGYNGAPAPPAFRGPPGLGGQPVYNPARMALRGGGQPDYRNREDREEENMVRMAEAILDHDYPSETHNSEERVQMFEKELEEKLKKLRAKG